MRDNTPAADGILIASLHGEAKRHSGGGQPLTEDEHAAAVAALRKLAAGRSDLLAHVAGICQGFGEGGPGCQASAAWRGAERALGAEQEATGSWTQGRPGSGRP